MKKIRFSLVVPFYNEELGIKKTALILNSFLTKHFKFTYELIFVNDGSSDNSLKILNDQMYKFTNTKLISYKRNRGRGYALAKGFQKASGEVVGYIDSDLEIEPKYIYECVKKIGDYDVVVVSKHLPGSKVETTLLRKWASKTYNIWVRFTLGSKVSDHQGGLKVFKRLVLTKILPKVHSYGWLFDTELLYYAQQNGFKVGEVPIDVRYGFGKIRKTMAVDYLKSIYLFLKLKNK